MNYYLLMGIQTRNGLPTEEIDDEIVRRKYEKVYQANKQVLNRLQEQGNNPASIQKAKEFLQQLKEAYLQIATEKAREEYELPYLKERVVKTQIGRLIEKTGGNPLGNIEIKERNKGNRAAEVRKESNYLEYTPEYEDEQVKLLGIEKIKFLNGNEYEDSIQSYTIFIKEKEDNLSLGYDFYSAIDLNQMPKQVYRIALYQAIRKGMIEKQNYIGTIEKDSNGQYFELRDNGGQDAANRREFQKYEERRKIATQNQEQEGVR